jgi:hypothetical protein
VILISPACCLAATQIVPSSYQYLNGNHPYGLLDSGGELTDGFYGNMNPGINLAAPDPSGWVEFGGGGEVEFNFDANVTITNIVLSMARWEPAAIYLPDQLKVNSFDQSGYPGIFADMDRALISLDGNWTGSNLTIKFSHSQYLFMDEVSFYGTSVPEPSTVALFSVALIPLLVSAAPRRIRERSQRVPRSRK